MFKIYKIYLVLIMCCVSIHINAQQAPNYTQYMYNTMAINPAYAGSSEGLNIVGIYRSQWAGFDGAPETYNLSIETPLTERVGLGVNVNKDVNGPAERFNFDGNFSYNIQLDRDLNLAFGIKAGAQLLNVDFSKGEFVNQGDPLLTNNVDNRLLATLGAGAFLYKYNWYVGVSVPDFFSDEYYDNVEEAVVADERQSYLTAGYVFGISDNIRFKPAALVNYVNGSPLRYNLSANFLFHDKLTVGASYQVDAAVSALAGFQISDNLFLGYSFDYATTEFTNYNDGTHEVILKFSLFKKKGMSFSPRFF